MNSVRINNICKRQAHLIGEISKMERKFDRNSRARYKRKVKEIEASCLKLPGKAFTLWAKSSGSEKNLALFIDGEWNIYIAR